MQHLLRLPANQLACRESMLELTAVTKSYGETRALDDFGFQVEPGQMFGFVGPNGSGKTTAR